MEGKSELLPDSGNGTFEEQRKSLKEYANYRDKLNKSLKHIYDLNVKKTQFSDYNYEEVPIQPLTSFFRLLAKPPEAGGKKGARSKHKRLRMWIPDTIVYGEGDQPSWYYSCAEGYVWRSDNFTEKHITKKLGARASDTELIACVKKQSWQLPSGNDLSLMNSKDLQVLLSSSASGQFVIQRFIKPRGPKAFVIRHVWRRTAPSYAFMISNKRNFDDHYEKDYRKKYATCTEQLEACTIVQANGRAITDSQKEIERMVKYLQSTLTPQARFDELVCDFIRGEDGRLWFIQCKAFKLDPKCAYAMEGGPVGGDGKPSLGGDLAGDDDEEDSDEAEVEDENKLPFTKDWRKLLSCKSCLSGYAPSELQYKLTLKMIMETEDHMQLRGKHLGWFDRTIFVQMRNAGEQTGSFKYQEHRVCKNCYDLYMAEQKLIDLEQRFARAIGIPMTEAALRSGHQRTRWSKGDSKLSDDEDDEEVGAGVGKEAVGGGARMEKNQLLAEYIIPQKLRVCRLLTFVHEVLELPSSEQLGYTPTHLEYNLCNFTTQMRLDHSLAQASRPNHFTLPLNKLRVYYFLADDNGLKNFINNQKTVDVNLFSGRHRRGKAALQLNQFNSGLVEKMEFTQLFTSKDLGMCSIKVTMGIVKGPLVDTSSYKLERHHGVYLPAPNFFTCDPLPKEWLRLIPFTRTEKKRKKKPVEVVDDMEEGRVADIRNLAELEKVAEEDLADPDEDVYDQDDDDIFEPGPRQLSNTPGQFELRVSFHAISHLTTSKPWRVAFNTLGRDFKTPPVPVHDASVVMEDEFEYSANCKLACKAGWDSIHHWVQAHPYLDLHVMSKKGTIGVASVDLQECSHGDGFDAITREDMEILLNEEKVSEGDVVEGETPCINLSVSIVRLTEGAMEESELETSLEQVADGISVEVE